MEADSKPLRVEDGTDLLILLLYSPGSSGCFGEPVEGITRLQKLVFLLQMAPDLPRLIDEAEAYSYDPYKLGPYSRTLGRDLEELEAARLVESERLDYWLTDDSDGSFGEPGAREPEGRRRVESYRFRLSENLGMKVGESLWKSLGNKERRELERFKKFFNALSLRQLLIFTYDRYPEYTSESTIREQLGMA